ncbi:MAG: acetyl-CoA carboxylase biotin carboxyl carrier protein [bacterium]|nr:acetyl-CoA carboxylase biotin carboxyl carrier protein [bacterium]
MDSTELKELIDLISRSSFASFELERDDVKLKVIKECAPAAAAAPAPTAAPQVAVAPAAAPAAAGAEATQAAPAPVEDGLQDMISPIVGTFYRAPGEESPPFVEVGSRISKGQVVCIVEAMKVMNEIESEFDGEIVEVPVSNGQPVEYGEVLFRLRPS